MNGEADVKPKPDHVPVADQVLTRTDELKDAASHIQKRKESGQSFSAVASYLRDSKNSADEGAKGKGEDPGAGRCQRGHGRWLLVVRVSARDGADADPTLLRVQNIVFLGAPAYTVRGGDWIG